VVNQQEIKFDFRFVGDSYYDANFQNDILKNKIFYNNAFYRPSESDYLYSLIYHAAIHKRSISKDYFHKIKNAAENNNFKIEITDTLSIYKALEDYIQETGYLVVKPQDSSVYFNGNNAQIYSLVKFLENKLNFDSIEFFLEENWQKDVFGLSYFIGCKGKDKFFIKFSDSSIGVVEREVNIINYLSSEDINISKLADQLQYKNFSILVLEFIEGESLDILLSKKNFSLKETENVILALKKLIKALHRKNLIHRDIVPANLIFSDDKLFLIDFSFAIDKKQIQFPELGFVLKNIAKIKDLGLKYKVDNFSWDDAVSCHKIIKEIYPRYQLKLPKEYLFFVRKRGKIKVSYKNIKYRFVARVLRIAAFISKITGTNFNIALSIVQR
jgi:hypothetical protein